MTAAELRARILETTRANGGHLSSSLGAVEIALALAQVFDPARDRIVWDVGHQAYAWKLLTGRAARFGTLRRLGGLSGFPNPAESPADAAVAGHAGVALSVAEGMAAARDRRGGAEHVVAVVGDGAMGNGTCFEALNDCAGACAKVILVLNDNEMSISRPTGALARLFGRLIGGVRYNRVKSAAEAAGHRIGLSFLRRAYHGMESWVKGLVLGSAFFERFGIRYVGPIDGHDVRALVEAFTVAKADKRSVVVHVVTRKGRGYAPAEADPTKYHGVPPAGAPPAGPSWSARFGDALVRLAREDDRIFALTAAMKDGTGLAPFAAAFPARFRDVGIAEGHMVAYAAGLAARGMRPVVAVYSTFLQRAVDQIMHDVCIARLPVVFCVDRAGIVGADGVTHQGLYDFAMLKCLPNLTICQPRDGEDLEALLREALVRDGPTVIRYPRGPAPAACPPFTPPARPRFAIWTTGDWYGRACEVAARLGGDVVHARCLKPFDAARLAAQRAAGLTVVSLENGCVAGGLGESLGADVKFGWPDAFIPHGTPDELERANGLDVESLVRRLAARLPPR